MKRILITGTSGFIGSRLAIRCREAGHIVTATARRALPELSASLGLEVRQLDVLDPSISSQVMAADAIFHCATPNDVLSRDFAAGVNLAVNGTRNVLELAVKSGIPRIVFFSTLQVYGTELQGEIGECTPPRCETNYGLNHLLGEEVCRMYVRRHNLDIVLARPANVFGVPDAPTVERSTLVPMCFVKEALATGGLVLRSSGHQKRNFVSTDEVADVCLRLLDNFPAKTSVINIGSKWHASVRMIAEMVAEIYAEKTGASLSISALSEIPERSNEFHLLSRLASTFISPDASRARMLEVIRSLFDLYAPSSPSNYD